MKLSVWGLLVLASFLHLTSFADAREPEFDDVKKSLVQVSGTWDGRKWIKIPDTNLAHVYPYNAMAYVVQDALNKWPDPAKNDRDIDHEAPARLLAFLDWLFLIDPQAVVNTGFHNSVPMAAHILHSVYLNNRGAGLVARNTVLKNEAKTKVDIDPAQLWRFNGDRLVNKQVANWQYFDKRWANWANDKEGALYDKDSRRYEQLTRSNEYDTREGSVVRLTRHFTYPDLWRKSRPITFEADPNVWFTLYNVKSKRYLTAANARSTKIAEMVQLNALDEPYIMKRCTSAPANLRYGDKWTNEYISNWLDPMGDVAGNPTDKECEGAKRPTRAFESFKQHSTDLDVMLSSTGSITIKEPASKDPIYDYYANRVTNTCRGRYGEWGHYLATAP